MALVSKATTADQRVVVSTLEQCWADAAQAALEPPCLFVVGEVVRLHGSLDWIGAAAGAGPSARPIRRPPARRRRLTRRLMTGRPLPPGIIVAAPASGSGKTTVTLGLVRRLALDGVRVASLKVGPDYIDPAFHAAAGGLPCRNLDAWAMRPSTLARVLSDTASAKPELVVVEGVMGLFDGAADGTGSTADIAASTGWPVVLVVDVRGQAASAAALVRGFASHRPDVRIAGVVFNRVGGEKHRRMLDAALAPLGIPVFGALPRDAALAVPDRHLGLVQAMEHADLDGFLDRAAAAVGAGLDLAALRSAAAVGRSPGSAVETGEASLRPPGQRIAVAEDEAFAFFYTHVAEAWHRAGATLVPFSAARRPRAGQSGRRNLAAGRLSGTACRPIGRRRAVQGGPGGRRGARGGGSRGMRRVHGPGAGSGRCGRADGMGWLACCRSRPSFADRRLHLGLPPGPPGGGRAARTGRHVRRGPMNSTTPG